MAISVGTKAPSFSLYDHTMTVRSLQDYAGKTVVLAFYPGAFTGVCTKEVCTLQDATASYGKLGAEVLGISVDMPFSAKVFAEKNNVMFPLLSDFDRSVIKSYGLLLENFAGISGLTSTQRAVVVVDGGGVVRYVEVTENPGVEPDYAALEAALSAM